ncbi:MAG: hypothetical protein WD534_18685 [Phycisphaeraceae bacterium]
MAYRAHHRQPGIVSAVIADKADAWNESTAKTAAIDAQAVLEALIAEYGIDATVNALNNQGFRGDSFKYLVKPLHEMAADRRVAAANPHGS